MIYLEVCITFFTIGLFSIGGGLATLPLLQEAVERYQWLTNQEFVDMIAISQSTPGPIGINMATYVGFNTGGILGALLATFSIILPSFIIIIIIAHFFMKFNEQPLVRSAFMGLRPAVTALIAAACFEVVKVSLVHIEQYVETQELLQLFDIKAIVLFLVLFITMNKIRKHPIVYIIIAAVIGGIFQF